MSHPRTYSDDDLFLADIRRLALALPEAVEVFTHHEGYGFALVFKSDEAERPALVSDPRFYVPPYFGPSGWLALDLTAAQVDWAEVAELLERVLAAAARSGVSLPFSVSVTERLVMLPVLDRRAQFRVIEASSGHWLAVGGWKKRHLRLEGSPGTSVDELSLTEVVLP